MEMNVNFRKERFSHTAKPKLNYVNSQVTDALSKSCGYSCQQPSCFSESLCPQDSWFQTVQIQLLFIFAFISWNNLSCKHCQSSPHTGYRISNIQQLSRCANTSHLVTEPLETLTAHHKTVKPLRVLFLLLFVCIWVWLWMNIHSMRGYLRRSEDGFRPPEADIRDSCEFHNMSSGNKIPVLCQGSMWITSSVPMAYCLLVCFLK